MILNIILNKSIWPIDCTLTCTTTPGQSKPGRQWRSDLTFPRTSKLELHPWVKFSVISMALVRSLISDGRKNKRKYTTIPWKISSKTRKKISSRVDYFEEDKACCFWKCKTCERNMFAFYGKILKALIEGWRLTFFTLRNL